ncbi:MAG: DUF3422 domain-containing protein [Pseudomonadota bacterium]
MPQPLFNGKERYHLANELHSRPFPFLEAPCRAVYFAIRPDDAEKRDLTEDRAHLADLIDRFGGAHPSPDAAFYSGELGRFHLKWEAHTEFVAYTLFLPGNCEIAFNGDALTAFPEDWLAALKGKAVAAAQVHVEIAHSEAHAETLYQERLYRHFVSESLATAFVVDREALVASDFRLHEDGFARIGVVAIEGIGPRRLGRIVQRLLEVESYKSTALMTLPVARSTARKVTEMDDRLAELIGSVAEGADQARGTLDALTRLSADVEQLSTETAFRFGAAGAYEAIVNDRIIALREERVSGRQLYSEFMKRRFDPAMRTCRSAERRLAELSDRLARASALLSTRVNVAVEAQNQTLLESMDKRADLQLRLQQTVEGLSVVAISYYALNLAAAILAPLTGTAGVDKSTTTALLALPVIGAVWWAVRRIRKRWEK